MIRRFLGLGLILAASGCALGNEYGYDPQMATMPDQVASAAGEDFGTLVKKFLVVYLGGCGISQSAPQFELQNPSTENSVTYLIRGLRGCVITGDNYWEILQVSFIRTSDQQQNVIVVIDGRIATGIFYPKDTQFTENMQPDYQGALDGFSSKMAAEFSHYEQYGDLQ